MGGLGAGSAQFDGYEGYFGDLAYKNIQIILRVYIFKYRSLWIAQWLSGRTFHEESGRLQNQNRQSKQVADGINCLALENEIIAGRLSSSLTFFHLKEFAINF